MSGRWDTPIRWGAMTPLARKVFDNEIERHQRAWDKGIVQMKVTKKSPQSAGNSAWQSLGAARTSEAK